LKEKALSGWGEKRIVPTSALFKRYSSPSKFTFVSLEKKKRSRGFDAEGGPGQGRNLQVAEKKCRRRLSRFIFGRGIKKVLSVEHEREKGVKPGEELKLKGSAGEG